MDVIPGSNSAGGIGKAVPGASNRGFPGIGAPVEASGASTPSDGGGNLRGLVRRQDSYGSVSSGGGGNAAWSGTGGSTAGAASESKQDVGDVSLDPHRLSCPVLRTYGSSCFRCAGCGLLQAQEPLRV